RSRAARVDRHAASRRPGRRPPLIAPARWFHWRAGAARALVPIGALARPPRYGSVLTQSSALGGLHMGYPHDVGVVDLMIGFPFRDKKATYEYLMPGIKDRETKEGFAMPAEYMFKQTPDEAGAADPITTTFDQMDRYNIDIGLFGLSDMSIEA